MLVCAATAQTAKQPCCDPPAPLPPLPETATAKERWLRRLHDEAEADEAPNIYLSTRYIDEWQKQLDALPKDAPLAQRFGAHWSLALALVRVGRLDEAAELTRACLSLANANPKEAAGWTPEVLFRLAAVFFRQAEKDNCIARHTDESCIFPLQGSAIHQDKLGAQAAVDVLTQLLARPGHDLHREARWLLNIGHMALGTWPDEVPSEHRIPMGRFAAEAEIGRFKEIGAKTNLARRSRAGSLVVDDFTGDGRVDVLACSFDTGQALRLCRNDGELQFTDVSDAAGLSLQLGGVNVLSADVDGDGLLDLLVLRGGGFLFGTEHPNSLLRQDQPGHFVDITHAAGIELAAPTRTASFADIDRDGDLDLFVGYESERRPGGGLRFPSKLWRNDGGGKFSDISASAGIVVATRPVGAVFGDVDNDGDQDLYVSNFLASNNLFINQGDGTFRDEAEARGVANPIASGPCGFFDYDNDGDLDLFVAAYHHYQQIRTVAAYYLEGTANNDGQRLFENDGRGRFTDVTAARGLQRALMATGLNFGDLDNDGRTDLYIATGAHDLAALFPNVLLLNRDRFADATFAANVGHLQKGNGVVFADLDADGDHDLLVQVGGWYQDDTFGDVVFENPGNQHRSVALELRGVRDNRFGVGARVRARLLTPSGPRDVCATVGHLASLGCNPLRAHLGLGDATAVEFVEITWPASGETQRVTGIPTRGRVRVTQGQNAVEILADHQ